MELKITDDRVREAAEKCPTAKDTLKTLFPEAFPVNPFKPGDLVRWTAQPDRIFMVMGGQISKIVTEYYANQGKPFLHLTDGSTTWNIPSDRISQVEFVPLTPKDGAK